MTSKRETDVYSAKLAEQAERYDEMVEHMTNVAKELEDDLTVEERNLLSVAYKNVIGARRASWRIINTIENKEQNNESRNERQKLMIKEYRETIEEELKKICSDILAVIDKNILPYAQAESKVFFNKMKGDYHRYLAEFQTGADRKKAAEASLVAYKEASDLADKELSTTHPIRLELDNLPEESYKDSTLIMQLLRDNLTLWTSDIQQNAEDDESNDVLQDVEDNVQNEQ